MLMRTTTARILVTVLIVAAVVMPPLVRAQPHHVQGQVEGPMFHTL